MTIEEAAKAAGVVVDYLDETDECASTKEAGAMCPDNASQCIACAAYRASNRVHGFLLKLVEATS